MMSKEDLTNYIHAKQRETQILSKNHLKNITEPRLDYWNMKSHVDNFLESDGEYPNRSIMMPGLRGVGKTTMLYQLYKYLTGEKNIHPTDILYLDVHELKSVFDADIRDVFEMYLSDIQKTTLTNLNKKVFLFVDEAQLDVNWANYAKLLFDKSLNVFSIFTGSSAITLNANTDATRRITKREVFPCDFKEYLLLKHNINLSKNNFKDLILKGPQTIQKAIECEEEIKKDLIHLNNDPEIELKKFLSSYCFPFALNMDEISTHIQTNNIIERIVVDDLKQFSDFHNGTNDSILKLIAYLAVKKPGSTSASAIAQSLNLNIRTVNNILSALEKSELLFTVNAYGSAGKMLKKPSGHFFATPSIKAAQNYRVGRYDLNHRKCYGALAENMVAASLLKLSKQTMQALGVFYDADRKGVDFVVKHLDRTIPVEVGVGKKTKSQLTRAINKFDAEYGILISNRTSEITFERNVINIPLLTFALM